MNNPKKIIISRTDGIGDVILTLPLCGVFKTRFPNTEILFLGSDYTKPVVDCCSNIDAFVSFDMFTKSADKGQFLKDLDADVIIHVFPRKAIAYAAKDAGIATRIGTSHRTYHWLSCNERPNIGRKNSKLHEAQLNLTLLEPLGFTDTIELENIAHYYAFENIKPLPLQFAKLVDEHKFNLILHPKSNGSAREWGLSNFAKLIELLPKEKFKIFISGTQNEKELLKELLEKKPEHVVDITGMMNLTEFISFINVCDGLVAASTGPLHIAAALGKHAYGLFAPIHPVHPGRWAPLGERAEYIMIKNLCNDCKNAPQACKCIRQINPEVVSKRIQEWSKYL